MGPFLSLETFSESFETLVVFVGRLAHLLIDLSLVVGEFTIPLVLAVDQLLAQACNLVILSLHVFVMSNFLCVQLVQMGLLRASSLSFLLLNLIHQLIDLSLETFLKFFFHLCVFFEFLSSLSQSHLKLLTSFFTFANKSLILCNVSF